jgi:hypothetical protein
VGVREVIDYFGNGQNDNTVGSGILEAAPPFAFDLNASIKRIITGATEAVENIGAAAKTISKETPQASQGVGAMKTWLPIIGIGLLALFYIVYKKNG